MRIVFLGKRRYTNKDALRERFGRIYQLPWHWHRAGVEAGLALLDYRGAHAEAMEDGGFVATSLPVIDPRTPGRLRAIVDRMRPDAVVASGDCFVGLAGLRLARRSGARFVFDAYDDYRSFGAYRAFLGWDAFGHLSRRADMTWYASRVLAPQQPGAWRLVPNGVDPAMFAPMDRGRARALAGLEADARWIGYFGSMEEERGPDDLVEAVGVLHARDPSIRLVLAGGDGRVLRGAPWVERRGNVPHAQVPALINACDVVVLPYRRGATIDKASSLKMAEYLFCGRPIVATRVPSLTGNFPAQAAELGEAVADPDDVADLARAIEWQLEHARIASRPRQAWPEVATLALESLEAMLADRLRDRGAPARS